MNRRDFLKGSLLTTTGLSLVATSTTSGSPLRPEPLFRISLAEWSLNRSLFDGKTNHLDFPALARKLDLEGVEYVNQFFMDKAKDVSYLNEMKTRAEGEGILSVLIMCDNEGRLGDPDEKERIKAVENHFKWADAARHLGCHAIRVNGYSEGSAEEQQKLVADGFSRLAEYTSQADLNLLIENHGGFSSNGSWIVGLVKRVNHPRFGTLPDWGNFRISDSETYDSYQGIQEMMPFAKGVSVKPKGYDAKRNEVDIDFVRMMDIVLKAGFRGFCGIEYGEEGKELESVGVIRDRLIAARTELGSKYKP